MSPKSSSRNKARATPTTLAVPSKEPQIPERTCDDELCMSAVLLAVADQSLEKLAKCLSEGHDLQNAALNRCTPLLLAVKLGNLEMVNMLLQHKASVDDVDASGATVLHHAAMNGFVGIANSLVAVGSAVIEQRNKAGCTPLYQAAQHGHIDCVHALLDLGANLEARTRTGATPLYIASDRGNMALMNVLLDAGADANTLTDFQMTPLLVASFNGHRDAVSLLLSRNIDIEQRGPCGGTALYVSAQEGHESVAELLIQRNADVNARCDAESDLTPSLIAAMQGHDKLVRRLLESKSDVGVTTGKGSTLAIIAARHGRTAVLQTLVEFAGPKVLNEKNALGLSALDVSKSGRHTEATNYIKSALEKQKENDLSAWEANLEDILEELDPPNKKRSKAKAKRKRKSATNCTREDEFSGVVELPADCANSQQARLSQTVNNLADDAESLLQCGAEVDINKNQDVERTSIVKPIHIDLLLESPAGASSQHPIPLLSPICDLLSAGSLTPKPATPCETSSPFGLRTVLPIWPSTPESWPSLPPADSLDLIDMPPLGKAQSGTNISDFLLPPWYSNSALGMADYSHSVFMASWLPDPCNFVPVASCGISELN
mmetsp:Transcript_10861/g.17928  ORF Transcript_10861/g.17928 Transcript_10861/m.17928 type:complete len:605 (+) Transcript_10861:110-1924(+)